MLFQKIEADRLIHGNFSQYPIYCDVNKYVYERNSIAAEISADSQPLVINSANPVKSGVSVKVVRGDPRLERQHPGTLPSNKTRILE